MNETVLVLTPRGRDADVATDLLKRHGIKAIRCEQLTGLSAAIERGAGAALVAEEALAEGDLDMLVSQLEQQPPWSDFPFIVLANGHKGVRSSRAFETLDQRLLAFARRQDLQPRAVDVPSLIMGIEDLVTRSIGPTIEVAFDAPSD